MLVVGMPNVGKSTLINTLRRVGTGGGKAAQTGAQPGITRKIGTPVKIVDGEGGDRGGSVYVLDTPGVFIPYVPDAESMLKLALCNSVKDTVIQPVLLADYLLYRLNKINPMIYTAYSVPTNDVEEWLSNAARRIGRLNKGDEPDLVATALWLVQRWRVGSLGKFMLDEVTQHGLRDKMQEERTATPSLSSAMKSYKASLKAKPHA
jgi:mitochondrial GTPase 1